MRCRYCAMERSTFSSSLAPMRGSTAQLLLPAEAARDRRWCAMWKCSKMSAIPFGSESLNLQEFERAGREFRAADRGARRSRVRRFPTALGQPFADAGNVGNLACGIAQDFDNAFRIALDGRGPVAVTADAETVFGGDFHQIGSLPEEARDFFVLQTDSSIQLYRVGLDLLALRRVVCICWLAAGYFP